MIEKFLMQKRRILEKKKLYQKKHHLFLLELHL